MHFGKFPRGGVLAGIRRKKSGMMMTALCTTLFCGPAFAQDVAPETGQRDFSVMPKVGIQESFTDNALLATTNPQTDFVTRFNLGGTALVNTGLTKANVDTSFSYDQYANNPSLSGWSLYANGTGSHTIIPGFLALEADGTVTNGNVSTFGTSAIDRSGTVGRIQLATFDVGPRVTTTIDDFADLTVLGRFAEVLYGAADTSNVAFLPPDSSIFEGTATVGTGDRFSGYELTTNANYQQDNHDFQLYNFTQSAFLRVAPEIRLIARGGYENIMQPGVIDMTAPIWSGGVEISVNRLSKITLEGGNRYDHATWNANVYLQFSDRIYVTGRYFEELAPAQIQFNNSFAYFLNINSLLPSSLTQQNFAPDGNVTDQTALAKTAETHVVYSWEGDTIDLSASWYDRRFIATGDHDRSLISTASYTRQIAPDLSAQLLGAYARTFASLLYGESETYSGEANVSYALNSTMDLRGGYALTRQVQSSPVHQTISENVVFAAIEKRF